MLNAVDLSRTDLNLLVLFEAVMEECHVGRAADRVNLTPSAVSHGLGRLRRLLGDPLFLRTPRGMVPTDRARELAAPIADVLARARNVIATAQPFDPAVSRRRFTVGAPDGVAAVLLPPLLDRLRGHAPGVDIAVSQLLPVRGEMAPERAWREALAGLEERVLDAAVIPFGGVPPRFHSRALYTEDFVIATRAGHPCTGKLTLDRYCKLEHLVVSLTGDARGFVDEALEKAGRTRRIALTVPNFLFALAVVAQTDLACALPRRFAQMHARTFGVEVREAPVPLESFQLHAVAPQVALMDAGLAWLLGEISAAAVGKSAAPRKTATARSR